MQVGQKQLPRESDGMYPIWAWPGGYPIYYLSSDCETICAHCANSPDFRTWDGADLEHLIIASDVNWEDPSMYCANCNERIESAYADEDADHGDQEGNVS